MPLPPSSVDGQDVWHTQLAGSDSLKKKTKQKNNQKNQQQENEMRGVIKLKSVLLFVLFVFFFLPSLPAQFHNFT
jgi:hypothetical protein